MSTRLAVIASAGAGVAALLWWRRRARRSSDSSTTRPVLCFGDSITEGYHGIWDHPEFGPKGKANCDELVHLRMHSYAIRLGALLARDAGAVSDASACDYSTALGYAEARAYSGWTAERMLPRLEAALRAGPWRCVCLMAGSNDIILEGAPASAAHARVARLHAVCDAAGVPLVVLVNSDCDAARHGAVPPADAAARRAALDELAARVRGAAVTRKRALADVRAAMPLDAAHADWWDDCIHPSPAGADYLAGVVHAAIVDAGL